jgi:hypothetical protein
MRRKRIPLPDLETIESLLHYDPETGEFTWKVDNRRARKGSVAGTISVYGYRIIKIKPNFYRAHRLAFLLMTGNDPGELEIDHIDGDRANNRWENIRAASTGQNNRNRKVNRLNKLGIKGVKWKQKQQCYRGTVMVDGKEKTVQSVSLDKVVSRLRAIRDEMHGEYANHG